jgi:HPt (histidine-containing phosphotransfer) domain-containing protein
MGLFRHLLLCLLLLSARGFAATLDLSRWNPEDHPTTILEGSWDFHWGHLWTPEDFQQGRVSDRALSFSIPGVWNQAKIQDVTLKSNHYATYRAIIQWPESVVQQKQLLTLSIASIPGAYKLWLDGNLAITGGTVGRSEEEEVAHNGGSFHTFMPYQTSMEIVIQISSFHHRDGGTWWPIRVGLADHVAKVHAAGVGLDGFTLSCLFIMAFYHFGLWLMRPQYQAPLAFAIFCAATAIRASVSGLGDLHILVFPGMPQHLQKIMEYAGFYLCVPAYYAFVRQLYPDEFNVWLQRTLWFFGTILALTTVTLPVRVFTDFIEYFQVITLMTILIMCGQLFRAARNGRDGIGLLLLGSFILFFSGVNDILHAHRIAPIPIMILPYGLFLMILCQAILLARRFSRAFQAVEVSERQIQSLNAELQNQNQILDSLAEEKTRDIRSIMKNIKQGIFTLVGDGMRIGSEFSDHLRSMVAAPDLKGGETLDSILDQADLSRDRRDQIKTVLSNVVGEDSIGFEVNAHLLPRELRLQRGDDPRLLEMDWSPIENENNAQIEKILVSLRDVTDLRLLQEESKRNQEELELIGEVLNVPTEKFDGLVQSCEKFLQDCRNQLQHDACDTHRLFRNMHTIKGVARSYGLTHLADAAHHAEEIYAQLRDGQNIRAGQLREAGEHVDGLLKRYDEIHRDKLGRKGQGTGLLLIERSVIAENLEGLRSLDLNAMTHDVQHRVDHLSRLFTSLIYMPLPKLLQELLNDVPRLAADLGKFQPDIIFRDPGLSIQQAAYDLFRNTFTHLLRNALDHGLETVEERQSRGKTARGRIVVELRLDESLLEIFVGDDGRGLNLEAIQRSARQRGLIASDASLSDYEIANLIFAPGLSTKEQVTAVSGRGVGLDAVKYFLEQYNGDIDIQLGPKSASMEGVPFRFHITLPSSVCEVMQSVGGARVASAS